MCIFIPICTCNFILASSCEYGSYAVCGKRSSRPASAIAQSGQELRVHCPQYVLLLLAHRVVPDQTARMPYSSESQVLIFLLLFINLMTPAVTYTTVKHNVRVLLNETPLKHWTKCSFIISFCQKKTVNKVVKKMSFEKVLWAGNDIYIFKVRYSNMEKDPKDPFFHTCPCFFTAIINRILTGGSAL